MNKKLIAFLAIISLSLSHSLISANAMENGIDAPLDGRTVPIIVPPMGIVCTGFLYSERIVFTGGHCLHDMTSRQPFQGVQIGAPNVDYTATSKRISVVKSFVASNWGNFGWSDEINFNPTGEFGIYILKEPIKVSGKVEVATVEKVKQLTSLSTLVTNIAYGKQLPTDSDNGLPSRTPKYAQFPLVPYETAKTSFDMALNFSGKKKYNMTIHVLQVPGGPSTCSSDSGSPFYVKENDTIFYLGPLSNGIGGIPNCSGKPWADSKMYMGSVAAYDYLDLIAQAEKYVADNPYIEPKSKTAGFNNKITITCIKGKTTKKVSGITPKCPVGYKKK
jgi:secreted trypsin-like serine protease